jgi:hypothetical protein
MHGRRTQIGAGAARRSAVVLLALAAAALTWFTLRSEPDSSIPAAAPGAAMEVVASDAHGELRPALAASAATAPEPDRAREATAPVEPSSALQRQSIEGPALRQALRGRVVEARTGQGLPYVDVCCRTEDQSFGPVVRSDRTGRFESRWTGSEAVCWLSATDALTGARLGRLEHEHAERDATPSDAVLPVEVGPTLIVRLVGAPADKAPWKVRILERPTDHVWSWQMPKVLEPDGALAARYVRFEHEPGLGCRTWIQVAGADESWMGEVEVAGPAGVHAVDVEVVPVKASLSGTVLDEDDRPVEGAQLIALHANPGSSAEGMPKTTPNDAGWFRLDGLLPGRSRLLVSSPHRAVQRLEVELEAGEEREIEVVLPRVRIGGSVSGALVGPRQGEEPIGIVHLRSADGGVTDLVQVLVALQSDGSNPPDDGRTPYAFPDVPAGRYHVSVTALDGRAYEPASAIVEAPGYAEFTTREVWTMPRLSNYSLRVRDAHSGATLDSTRSLLHMAPFWSTEPTSGDLVQELAFLGEGAEVTLVVGRQGYVPAALYLPEAYRSARRVGEQVEVQLALEPGFGAALVVLDGGSSIGGRAAWSSQLSALPGIAGAKIVANGRVIGTSDARGLALCRSDAPIVDIQVELAGWSTLAIQHLRGFSPASVSAKVQTVTYYRAVLDGLGYVLMVRD